MGQISRVRGQGGDQVANLLRDDHYGAGLNVDDFRPWEKYHQGPSQLEWDQVSECSSAGRTAFRPGRASAARGAEPSQANQSSDLQLLLEDCCRKLGHTPQEAAKWLKRLSSQWITSLEHLAALRTEDWSRLGLPIVLEGALKRGLGVKASPNPVAESPGPVPSSRPVPANAPAAPFVPPGRSRALSAPNRPAWHPQDRRAPGGSPKKARDVVRLRGELRRRYGEEWTLVLLQALRRKQTTDNPVDLTALQASIKLLGLAGGPATTLATLKGVLEEAQRATPAGWLVDGQAVVAAIHGPLTGRRSEAVRMVFQELTGGRSSLLAVASLKPHCNILEHPAVKANAYSAKEALAAFFRVFRGREAISEEDFVNMHVPVSALAPGNDSGFATLVRRLWRCSPGTSPAPAILAWLGPQNPGPPAGLPSQSHQRRTGPGRPAPAPLLVAEDLDVDIPFGFRNGRTPAPPPPAALDVPASPASTLGVAGAGSPAPPLPLPPAAAPAAPAALQQQQQQHHPQKLLRASRSDPALLVGRRRAVVESPFGGFVAVPSISLKPSRPPGSEKERRRHIESRISRSRGARDLLVRVRTIMRRRGGSSALGGEQLLTSLTHRFRAQAKTFGVQSEIGAEVLRAALNQVGVGAPAEDVEALLIAADIDGSGNVPFEELVSIFRGGLSSARAYIVREVFNMLDRNGDGSLNLHELQAKYRPSTEPDVEAGRKDIEQALMDFILSVEDSSRNGRLTLEDFERFYESVSSGIDSDNYFQHIVRMTWGLNSNEHCHGARNCHRGRDGSLQVTEGGICGRNDGW